MPRGIVYRGDGVLHEVRKDLLKVAAFLQLLYMYQSDKLIRYDDWWEHDGLDFSKGCIRLQGLFRILDSSRGMHESMPGDDDVHIGIGPEDESWYLRFYADWDHDGEQITSAYAIAWNDALAKRFEEECLKDLNCHNETLESDAYYQRICEGELSH